MILTEPAFWTPDLPNLYRVEARVEPPGGEVGPVGGEGCDFLAVMLPAGGLPHDTWRSPPAQPLVAWRQEADVAAPRAACDALQRDLALWRLAGAGDSPPWDWAGYLVG